MPFTPGGAGVQQALLVKVFSGQASTAVVAAYSVGQQIAIAAFTALLGLAAVFFIFRFRSFREVISAGRASQQAEKQAESEGRVSYSEPLPEEAAETADEARARRRRERRAGSRY